MSSPSSKVSHGADDVDAEQLENLLRAGAVFLKYPQTLGAHPHMVRLWCSEELFEIRWENVSDRVSLPVSAATRGSAPVISSSQNEKEALGEANEANDKNDHNNDNNNLNPDNGDQKYELGFNQLSSATALPPKKGEKKAPTPKEKDKDKDNNAKKSSNTKYKKMSSADIVSIERGCQSKVFNKYRQHALLVESFCFSV